MTIDELNLLTRQVLWASFFVSLGFGALVQKTGFCTMGAVSEADIQTDLMHLEATLKDLA